MLALSSACTNGALRVRSPTSWLQTISAAWRLQRQRRPLVDEVMAVALLKLNIGRQCC